MIRPQKKKKKEKFKFFKLPARIDHPPIAWTEWGAIFGKLKLADREDKRIYEDTTQNDFDRKLHI